MFLESNKNVPNYITVDRQVILRGMYETPVIVCTQVADLIEVLSKENIAKIQAWMDVRRITDVYRDYRLYITAANFSRVNMNLPKSQNAKMPKVGLIAKVAQGIIHIKDECHSYPLMLMRILVTTQWMMYSTSPRGLFGTNSRIWSRQGKRRKDCQKELGRSCTVVYQVWRIPTSLFGKAHWIPEHMRWAIMMYQLRLRPFLFNSWWFITGLFHPIPDRTN